MEPAHLEALSAAIQERESRGWQQVGWKLGFGSPQGLETLHLDRPLVAALFDVGQREPEQPIPFSQLVNPVVEPEIAARMRETCTATDSPATLASRVGALVPAIEVADLSFPPQDPVEVLRANIYQHAWIAPQGDGSGWGSGGSRTVLVDFDDDHWVQEDPEQLTGSMLAGLAQCHAVAEALGRGLLAGDMVFLGSVIPPIPVVAGEFSVAFQGGNGIAVRFDAGK